MVSNPTFSYLNEQAIAAAPLACEPYDWAFVDEAIPASLKNEVLADAPRIPDRGSYGLPSLRYGPRFRAVIDDLLSARFRGLVEAKFDIDLSRRPPVVLMMGNTFGHYNEGFAHTDSRHQTITVLVGFSREWPWRST